MAFLDTCCKDRFSLLLLEPGEIYFEDFSVFCYLGPLDDEFRATQSKQKGRLKICSKSLVFEPQDVKYPLLKIPYADCQSIDKWAGPLISRITNKNGMRVITSHVSEMLERNILAPYVFKRERHEFLFVHNYTSVEDSLPKIQQLRRAATLPRADQASMIATIVYSLQKRIKFNMSWIDSLYESEILEVQANRVTPLVINPGRVFLTDSRLYFQPYNNAEPWPVLKLRLSNITRMIPRRFLLHQVGLELFCNQSSPLQHLFLSFKNSFERNQVYHALESLVHANEPLPNNMTLLWQNREVSNYDYLLYLNSLADRSFNDLTQYPVFPWVLQDYESKTLDLEDPSVFRDLSKPIGALNPERLARLKERALEMEEMGQSTPFLYGSHYSTPGFILFYLVRKYPQYMLCLQNGRFDHPDRMFNSMQCTWRNVTVNTSDFKELIPEFFDPSNKGDFLLNTKNLNFGFRQDGVRVGDVELPPWASGPEDFIKKMREALESDHVSNTLHLWIDLIFGYKQRGEEAVKADNLFHPMTYEGSLDLESIKDVNERYSREVQIMEYGQIPKQIFIHPHPQRELPASIPPSPPLPPAQISSERKNSGFPEKVSQRRPSLCFWHNNLTSLVPITEHKLHKEAITDICISSDLKTIFSTSMDSQLKMYSLELKSQVRSINVFQRLLSSCSLLEDENFVAVASSDHYVYLYNLKYGNIIESTLAHDDALTQIHWNRGLLATASWDATAKIWKFPVPSLPSQKYASTLLAELDHDARVLCLHLSPDNTLLATGSAEGIVYLWDLQTYDLRAKYTSHEDEVSGTAFSLDGRKLATCSRDGRLWVVDVTTGTTLFSKDGLGAGLNCICWDGSTLLAGTQSGHIQVWDLVRARLVSTIMAHDGGVTCLQASQDGTLVASGGVDQKVKIWQPHSNNSS